MPISGGRSELAQRLNVQTSLVSGKKYKLLQRGQLVMLLAGGTCIFLYDQADCWLQRRAIAPTLIDGFTGAMHRLVYFEVHANAESAITREKRLKQWRRAWKIELIERDNPNWVDLFPAMRLQDAAERSCGHVR